MKKITTILSIAFSICIFTISHAQLDDLKKALGNIPGMVKTDATATKQVESINWKPLSKILPESIDGFESSKLDGGTFKTVSPTNPTEQYSYSSVSKKYTQGKKKLTITIMDSGYNQLLLAPFLMSYEYDGPQGYMKSTKIGEHNAREMIELDGDDVKSANIMVAVNDRVLVMFESKGGMTIEEVKKQSSKMSYDKIVEMIGETEKNVEKSESQENNN